MWQASSESDMGDYLGATSDELRLTVTKMKAAPGVVTLGNLTWAGT